MTTTLKQRTVTTRETRVSRHVIVDNVFYFNLIEVAKMCHFLIFRSLSYSEMGRLGYNRLRFQCNVTQLMGVAMWLYQD